jgi:hypothetical protein
VRNDAGTNFAVVGDNQPDLSVHLRFKPPQDWQDNSIYCYIWGDKCVCLYLFVLYMVVCIFNMFFYFLFLVRELTGSWPGQQLTNPSSNFYTYSFDSTGINFANAIFNNGNGGSKADDVNALEGGCYEGGQQTGTDGDGVKVYGISQVPCPV